MTARNDEPADVGLRIARNVQKMLQEDNGSRGIAFDIVLRNGATIERVWKIEVEGGMVRTNSAASTARNMGLAYAFPAVEIALARPHNDRRSAGGLALEWGIDALRDKEVDYVLAVRTRSGLQINHVHSIEIDGKCATIESSEVCDSGNSHIIDIDRVEAVWVEDAIPRKPA